MNKALDRAAFSIVAVIAGYAVGGWVYEVAGDHVWAKPANWIYDYQTLVAGTAAVVAAVVGTVVAWRGIEQQLAVMREQISAGQKQREEDARLRNNAVANALMLMLIGVAGKLAKAERLAGQSNTFENERHFLRIHLRDAAGMSAHLAAALMLCEQQLEAMEMALSKQRSVYDAARLLNFRTLLLSEAFAEAANKYARGEVPIRPLILPAAIERIASQCGLTGDSSDLGWINHLLAREF
ncbi:MAG TPA: hypothetical protein VHD36_02100 [Pirellulales bacterium]|nr:hypothetical protein [Pirellulales bacterium]HVY21650.1 hypothetical protein [Bauldia sp.]